MKIGIGNDHAAVAMKKEITGYLEELGLRSIWREGCKGGRSEGCGLGDSHLRDRSWYLACG